jgi:hypothetical protein
MFNNQAAALRVRDVLTIKPTTSVYNSQRQVSHGLPATVTSIRCPGPHFPRLSEEKVQVS